MRHARTVSLQVDFTPRAFLSTTGLATSQVAMCLCVQRLCAMCVCVCFGTCACVHICRLDHKHTPSLAYGLGTCKVARVVDLQSCSSLDAQQNEKQSWDVHCCFLNYSKMLSKEPLWANCRFNRRQQALEESERAVHRCLANSLVSRSPHMTHMACLNVCVLHVCAHAMVSWQLCSGPPVSCITDSLLVELWMLWVIEVPSWLDNA